MDILIGPVAQVPQRGDRLGCVLVERALARIGRMDSVSDALEFSRDRALAAGVIRQSYHFTPIFKPQNSSRTIVQADGYSVEWLQLYANSDFRRFDPIPDRTMQHGSLLTWADAIAIGPNTLENEVYFAAMAEHGLIHGFGVPLYGPHGRNAYASFDFGKPIGLIPEPVIAGLCGIASAGHIRICTLLDEGRDRPELSVREREVLKWMAQGKSNTDIGTILDISPETVRTYAQRIYHKVGSHDRVAAIIKALRSGLIEY